MIKVRKNYDRIINALYRALYTDVKLVDFEIRMIIEYIMGEYK